MCGAPARQANVRFRNGVFEIGHPIRFWYTFGHRPMFHSRCILVLAACAAMLVAPAEAHAGMPAPYTLRDLARTRVETISFFLAVVLVSAKCVQWLWNGLRSPAGRLPWISYPKSLGLIVLWGLLFSVVLAMISGARELMTPGAWEKRGATYRLRDGDP